VFREWGEAAAGHRPTLPCNTGSKCPGPLPPASRQATIPPAFTTAAPPAEITGVVKIDLALAAEGLPLLLTLTEAANDDGISFGLLNLSDLDDAIAASSNPAASLKDNSM
jgi:hypothetical protein